MSRKNFVRLFMETVRRLYQEENGAIISAELALVGTVGVLAVAAGLNSVSTAVNQELSDFGNAISSLNQSFSVGGFQGGCGNSFVAGSSFTNSPRNCGGVSSSGSNGNSSAGSSGASSSSNGGNSVNGQDIVSGVNGVRSTGAAIQGVLQVVPNSTLQLVPNTTFQVVPNTTFQVVPNSTLQLAPNSTFQVVPNSTLQIVPNSTFQIVPNSTLQFVPNSTLQLKSPSRCVQGQGQGGAVNDKRVEEPDGGPADATTPANRKAPQSVSEEDPVPMAKPKTAPKTKIPMPQEGR